MILLRIVQHESCRRNVIRNPRIMYVNAGFDG